LSHGDARLHLIAHLHHCCRRRADEGETDLMADLGKAGVLREEAIAGVDCLTPSDKGGADEIGDAEIAFTAWARADADALVRQPHRQRVAVGLRIGDDRLDTKLAARAQHTQRDLTAIGDKHLLEHAFAASLSDVAWLSGRSSGWWRSESG